MNAYRCFYTPECRPALKSSVWEQAEKGSIDKYPWKSPEEAVPVTDFRVLHTPKGLSVRFDVREKNIQAIYTQPNDPVWRDSCVEFFFSPNPEDERYFSFEVNPLGSMLIGLGSGLLDIQYLNTDREIFSIEASLHEKEDFWQAAFHIPYTFTDSYYKPISQRFNGNFMKCADDSITPHHGSWSLIETTSPMFHVPSFFSVITLEAP